MKKFINVWHYVSVYLAGLTALIAIFFPVTEIQKCFLAAITILFLHFFEEFGFPGGFPYMGMKVLMKSEETDSTKWSCNNLSSMFGNWGFLFLLYIIPLIFPINFLILSGMLFLFAEVFMHLILFNVAMKTFYNPGMITGIFGCGAIGIYYFTQVFDKNIFVTTDYIFAVIYFVAVFVFSFRSKLYWDLGKNSVTTLQNSQRMVYSKCKR